MDKHIKLIAGKALGEIYEIQKKQGINKVDDGHVYGLLHGFEEALNKEFDDIRLISEKEVNTVYEYFKPYIKAETETDDLPPYDEMREEMKKHGISPKHFITILRYLNACDRLNVDVNELGNFKLTNGEE